MNAVSDIRDAAVFHPDNPKFVAVGKCLLIHFPHALRERDFFNLAIAKTLFSDVLHTVLNCDVLKIIAALKRLRFDSL